MAYVPATIIPSDGSPIQVMFNPAEYSISRDVSYSEKEAIGKDNRILQFISGGTETLTLSLVFNTYSFDNMYGNQKNSSNDSKKLDVNKIIEPIYELSLITNSKKTPPVCTFSWSSLQFKGIITGINRKFTMFLDDGTPVRATLEITFKNIFDVKKNDRSSDETKITTVNENTQLWEQSYKEYDNCSKWREIAKANKISDPLDIKSGDNICIPSLK